MNYDSFCVLWVQEISYIIFEYFIQYLLVLSFPKQCLSKNSF
jgi:hypothetical protein